MRTTILAVANALYRGIEANYNPETAPAKANELIEMLEGMVMSRACDAEDASTINEEMRAMKDAELIDHLAGRLEGAMEKAEKERSDKMAAEEAAGSSG